MQSATEFLRKHGGDTCVKYTEEFLWYTISAGDFYEDFKSRDQPRIKRAYIYNVYMPHYQRLRAIA